ncbi:hypothetical protein [Anaeromyxobacter terrae]|uniref:hypothetical protein n=1 Tax=Anaeromyxobacter terrae TaxID=2925406 RepID=UPI001F5A04AC|nr:hypothetical protein [Anaeromyxobacter sp. SG22]
MTARLAKRALGATLLVLLSIACRRPEGPADRYRVFAAAARAGDTDTVWSMLSERSRARLEERAKEVGARAAPGVLPATARELVLGDLAPTAGRVASVTVRRESRDAAVLAVEVEGAAGPEEVEMVREDGRWRVVLPGPQRPSGR